MTIWIKTAERGEPIASPWIFSCTHAWNSNGTNFTQMRVTSSSVGSGSSPSPVPARVRFSASMADKLADVLQFGRHISGV